MLKQYQNALNTLLGYCKAKDKWEVGFDDPPYDRILPLAKKYYGDLWSYDLFHNLLSHHLYQQKDTVLNGQTAKAIIDNIEDVLHQNMQDIFIIAPLKGAWISSSVVIGDFAIVKTSGGTAYFPSALPQNEIITEIASITGFTEDRISEAIAKITFSRAKDLLSCPLLIVKRYGQYNAFGDLGYCHFLFRYLNRFIRLVASHNKVTQDRKHLGWVEADQFFCIDRSHNYNHYPIRDTLSLNYNLTFLTNEENQTALKKIIDLFESKEANELQVTYFRSMKFYNSGLTNQEFSVDAISQQLLNTLIAAETLLSFTTRGEKKSKLAHVMTGLTEVDEANKSRFIKAVIEAYIDRSSLMHAGKQELSKYMIDMQTDRRESESLTILSELMTLILIKFPDWYEEIAAQGSGREFLLLWQEKIKGYIPMVKYTLFQRLVSRIIVFLQKISKVKTEH